MLRSSDMKMPRTGGATALNPRRRIPLSLALLVVWLVALLENHGIAVADSGVSTASGTVYLPLVSRACASVELIQDGGFEAGLPNLAWQSCASGRWRPGCSPGRPDPGRR